MQDLSAPVLIGLGVLVVVQLVLTVAALVDLGRRPSDQVVGGKKWPWLLVILLISTVGAIVYFAAGRTPAPVAPSTAGPRSVTPDSVADSLYGKDPGSGTS